jgi:hypothetical protein
VCWSLAEDEFKVVRGPRGRIRGGYHRFPPLVGEQDDRGTRHANRRRHGEVMLHP